RVKVSGPDRYEVRTRGLSAAAFRRRAVSGWTRMFTMTGQRLTLAVVMVVVSATTFDGQAAAKATDPDQETAVQLKNLPPAVRATVEAEAKSATIKGISKEKE